MGHKETIESVESWPTSPSVAMNTLEALIALYRLLDERLPAPAMTILTPAPAPVEDSPVLEPIAYEPLAFRCATTPATDVMTVFYADDEDKFVFEAEMTVGVGDRISSTEIHLSVEDATILANRILRTV